MLTIAGITFKEAIRKKILVAAIILTLLFLVLYGTGLYFTADGMKQAQINQASMAQTNVDPMMAAMEEQWRKMFLLLGVYFASSIVALLAVFSSVGSISAEVENGMLHAILAKPIRRSSIVLGKFLGYALMLACYAGLLFASIIALNRYFMGTEVTATVYVLMLFMLKPLILLAVTVAGSTRFSTLSNGIIAFMLYIIGSIGGMVEQVGAILKNETLVYTGIVSSLVVPIDSIYRLIVDVIVGTPANSMLAMVYGPFGAISKPSSAMAVYALLYLMAFLFVASRSFTKRDIG